MDIRDRRSAGRYSRVSRDKGIRAAAWVAAYVSRWWPAAEKNPPSRPRLATFSRTPYAAFDGQDTGESGCIRLSPSTAYYALDYGGRLAAYLPPALRMSSSEADALAAFPYA